MADSFDIIFNGNSKSECIEFIQAVQKYAKKNKKMRDNQWIADEVYGAFGGEALGWYVLLPVNVREDWELLQRALATRWILEVDDSAGGNVTSPAVPPMAAAAPLAAYLPQPASSTKSTPSGTVGRVRVGMRGIGNQDVRYLSSNTRKAGYEGWLGAFDTTTNAALAMKVRLVMVGPNLHRLELVEHESKLSVLAAFLYWNNDWYHTTSWGILVGVDAPGQGALRDRRTTFSGNDNLKDNRFWTERWQLGNNGVLTLCGPEDTTEDARFALRTDAKEKGFLLVMGPKTSYGTAAAQTVLEFEPFDG